MSEGLPAMAPGASAHAVPLAPDLKGMRCNLEGMIRSARRKLAAQGGGLDAHLLEELLENLKEVAVRYYAGDIAGVDEFLQLYCLGRDLREAAVRPSLGQASGEGGASNSRGEVPHERG